MEQRRADATPTCPFFSETTASISCGHEPCGQQTRAQRGSPTRKSTANIPGGAAALRALGLSCTFAPRQGTRGTVDFRREAAVHHRRFGGQAGRAPAGRPADFEAVESRAGNACRFTCCTGRSRARPCSSPPRSTATSSTASRSSAACCARSVRRASAARCCACRWSTSSASSAARAISPTGAISTARFRARRRARWRPGWRICS